MCSETHSGSDKEQAFEALMGDTDDLLGEVVTRVIKALTPDARVHLLKELVVTMIMDSGISPNEHAMWAASAHMSNKGDRREQLKWAAGLALASEMTQGMTMGATPTPEEIILLAESAASGELNKYEL